MNNTFPYPSLSQAWGIFGLFIAITIGVAFLLLVVSTITGYDNLPLINLVGYTLSGILILLYIQIRKKSAEPSEAFIHPGAMPVSLAVLLLLITISVAVVIDPLTNIIPLPEFMEEIFDMLLSKSPFNLVLVVFIGPVFEEILLRGIILDGFLRRYSTVKSILWSSFIFGLLHLNPWQFFGAFIAGLLLGYVYWKTRSLIAVIFVHMINNGFGYTLSYIYGSDVVTLTNLFNSRRDYLILYFASLVITVLLLLILHKILSRQKEVVWKG